MTHEDSTCPAGRTFSHHCGSCCRPPPAGGVSGAPRSHHGAGVGGQGSGIGDGRGECPLAVARAVRSLLRPSASVRARWSQDASSTCGAKVWSRPSRSAFLNQSAILWTSNPSSNLLLHPPLQSGEQLLMIFRATVPTACPRCLVRHIESAVRYTDLVVRYTDLVVRHIGDRRQNHEGIPSDTEWCRSATRVVGSDTGGAVEWLGNRNIHEEARRP